MKPCVDRFVIVSIFIPKLRLILILNSFLGSSDSLVFSELFHSDRKSGSAGMPRPISYAVFCLKKKTQIELVILDLKYQALVFFFNDTATTEIYTLSLHDALPI